MAVRTLSGRMLFPQGRVDGCKVETISATLIGAENSKIRIDGVTGQRTDLEKQRADEEAAEAEQQRTAAEEQAKKDAAETARQKRLAEERRKKQAAEDARYAKAQAEQHAREADERRKIQAACRAIFQNTVDKKIKDLTVREEQQVRSCQALGLYSSH